MKYIKKLIRNSKRALNQQVIKKKQEIVKYAPRLTGIQATKNRDIKLSVFCCRRFEYYSGSERRGGRISLTDRSERFTQCYP